MCWSDSTRYIISIGDDMIIHLSVLTSSGDVKDIVTDHTNINLFSCAGEYFIEYTTTIRLKNYDEFNRITKLLLSTNIGICNGVTGEVINDE